jgi:hypothetical protein
VEPDIPFIATSTLLGVFAEAEEPNSGCVPLAAFRLSRLSEGIAGGVGAGIAVACACVFSVVGVFKELLCIR